MNVNLEILSTQKWLIDYDFGIRAQRIVNAMMNGHLIAESEEKVYGYYCDVLPNGEFAARVDDDERGGRGSGVNEQFIDVLFLDGPITREGGACTYGSRQLRDMMMDAADTEGCIGHLLLINGPGGVSSAIPDFLQATDYARSKGQPIVGRIDGCCASAHLWISAMCDEVYYNNPADQIGSVGVYWAGILNKNGDKDPDTGGTWHIVYDPESFDKNRFVRDLAENDDDKLIKEELKKDGAIFRNFVKNRRPNVKDEHLHGKMFDVKDVEGILVTGQATMQETFNRIVELSGNKKASASAKASAPGRMQAAAQLVAASQPHSNSESLTPQNKTINMKEKFPALFAALQVEEMQMTEDGAFLNAGLLATLNAAIEAKEKEAADAKALVDSLTAEKAEIESQLATKTAEVETLNAEHQKAIEDMTNSHAAAIEEKDNQIAALEQEKADLQGDIEGKQNQIEQLQADVDGALQSVSAAEQTIAERDQTISDLNAQIEEMAKTPGHEPKAGKSPETNGGGADAPEVAVASVYAYDNSKTYEENMKAKAEFDAKQK